MTQKVTVNEMIQAALNAEKLGVTVDWRDMTLKVANVATQVIENLERQLPAASKGEDS